MKYNVHEAWLCRCLLSAAQLRPVTTSSKTLDGIAAMCRMIHMLPEHNSTFCAKLPTLLQIQHAKTKKKETKKKGAVSHKGV
jgi:hypothetical protein